MFHGEQHGFFPIPLGEASSKRPQEGESQLIRREPGGRLRRLSVERRVGQEDRGSRGFP